MSNNRLGKGKQVRDTKGVEPTQSPSRIRVDHGNAPLVSVGILAEIRDLLKKLVEKDG